MTTFAQVGAIEQPWTDDRLLFLDRVQEMLRDGEDVTGTMNTLSDGLWHYRVSEARAWKQWVAVAKEHSLKRLVHLDPFTRRAFDKPRGYAGDAALLDLIYYDQGLAVLNGTPQLGQAIFWRNRNAPAPQAVRERRDHMGALIDCTALRRPAPRVLSVAAGHLREALKSTAVVTAGIGELVAFDQDRASLEEVARTLPGRVTCYEGSIRDLLRGTALGNFDLIYAAGLFDYLESALAKRLIRRLFEALTDGGQLVIANFVPDIRDSGYMETYMGWDLIFRSPDEILDLASELPPSVRGTASTYFLHSADICYLSVRR